MNKIYKIKYVVHLLCILSVFMLCSQNVCAAPKIEYSYSSNVTCGTIRYISQITGSKYFNWSYWPANSFGGYVSPGSECGTCSISMALSYIGINKTPKQILEANNGVTYFSGWGVSLSQPSITNGMNNYMNGNGKYSPVIVHFKKGSYSTDGHYVILIDKLSSSSYQVLDPAKDDPWTLSTGSSLYAAIDEVYQYYNSSAVIPSVTPTGTQTISDGEYHIVSAIDSSYALNVFNASADDRVNINIYQNRHDSTQTFKVTYLGDGYYKIINSNTGKAVDVEDYGTANGTNVIQYRSTGNTNQQWVIKESEDGQYFYIISKCNGLYLDVDDGVAENGRNVQVWEGNKSTAQKWRFIAWGNNTGQTIPDGRYHLLSGVETSKGFDVYQGGKEDLTNVQLYKNNRSVNQTFDITYLGDGYYKIIDINSGKALAVQENKPVKSANVCINNYDSGTKESKQWIIKAAGGGWYNLISKGSGLYVDVTNGNKEDRTNIQMWIGHDTVAQKWAFVPVKTDNKITFDLNGGTIDSEIASRKIDAYNYSRGEGELLIYECENFLVTTNKYGKEAAVDANGKVIEIRPYESESYMTVPNGGFIVSGHVASGDNGARFVDNLQVGKYAGYDLNTNIVYAYNSQNEYLYNFKYVATNENYGTLPIPTRDGYDFTGWYTSASGGTKITETSEYSVNKLYAQWSEINDTTEDDAKCTHTNTTEYPAKASTCSEQGNDAYTICNDCGEIISGTTEKLPLDSTNHVHTTIHPTEEGSCIEPGHAEYVTCDDCNTLVSGSDAPVPGPHGTFVEKAEEKYLKTEADCENAAIYYKSCELCGEAHDTATFTSGSAKGHDYADATCTAPKTCKTCGATTGEALGHNYSTSWSKNNEGHWRACTVCGDKVDYAAHNYGTGEDTCAVCGYERSHVHNLTLVPAKEVTCTEDGNKAYYSCSNCDDWFEDAAGTKIITDKSSVTIKALGHYFSKYVSNNNATCTEDGTKTAMCDRCGKKDTTVDTGSAKGHDYADATCTAPKTCKTCGTTIGEALGHNYSTSWSKNNERHWRACTVCGDKVDYAAHNYETGEDACAVCGYERAHVHELTLIPAVEATSTKDGNKAYYVCSGCNDWFEDVAGTKVITDKSLVIVKATGNITPGSDDKEPTDDMKNPAIGEKIFDAYSNAIYRITGNTSDKMTVEYIKWKNETTKVTIPTTVEINGKKYQVTSIANNAFKNKKKLKKIVIPATVEKIGKKAFFNCKDLKKIVIKTKKLKKNTIGKNAFKGVSTKTMIKVPKTKRNYYRIIFRLKGLSIRVKVR